ncbi:MAG: SURF1 family protein [Ilumatobacteraceae bacterium]|nr:SURF1 family protein [Ilumatobacteraceae bacterium]
MYRFLLRPTWIAFHLLVVAGIITMINLGFWQLRRLDERQAFNAVVEQRYDAPPLPLDELLVPGTDPDAVAWRPVTASGTYLPDERVLIVNRSQNGRAGVNTVVPMRLDDGRILLVNRGFVPLAFDPPPVPAREVAVTGRLRPSQERGFGQLSDPADGALAEAQRLDIERLAAQLDGEVVPMYIDLIESVPAELDGLPEPVIAPDLSEGNHLSYAAQWFIFSIAVGVGWVLAVRRSIATRRRADTR